MRFENFAATGRVVPPEWKIARRRHACAAIAVRQKELGLRKLTYTLLAAVMVASGAAIGKLPPATPEEQAAAAAKKAQQQEQLEKEKVQLENAQDRVVARYKKEHGGPGTSGGGKVSDTNMPKTTKELPRGVGPKPDSPQSAEAHSAPAK